MICITFDTDWMTDAHLARFLEEFPVPGRATFFCHDAFASVAASPHERCPHPFIADLDGWQDPLRDLTQRVDAAARGVRPHSCVFSHMVGVGLHALGFDYVSQANNLYQSRLAPFRHPWGVWELPIYYMDNMDFWMPANWTDLAHQPFDRQWIDAALANDDLYVFDFHPLHIALNTRAPDDYQRVKPAILSGTASPFDLTMAGRGTREFYLELCQAMTDAGHRSLSCSEALDGCTARRLPPLPRAEGARV